MIVKFSWFYYNIGNYFEKMETARDVGGRAAIWRVDEFVLDFNKLMDYNLTRVNWLSLPFSGSDFQSNRES